MSLILTLPGIQNSGIDHWQTLWETLNPRFQRVQQRDWNNPKCSEWVESLERAVQVSGSDVILVAHSLACLLVAHWAEQTSCSIKAAMLVAVPDPSREVFPKEAVGFTPLPLKRLAFPSVLIASSDDPYSKLEFSTMCATAWGSRLVNVGALGHINASSHLGVWDQGLGLLNELEQSVNG